MIARVTPGRLATALGLAAFWLYAWAAGPTVDWLDAGELTAAGFTLGVSHPPGQPGHALLVKLASLLPFGEIAFRAALLSAAAGAAAVAGTVMLGSALVARQASGTADDPASLTGAAVAAALVGLSPIVFAQATRPEVYAPVLALVTWGAVCAIRFVRAGGTGPARDPLLAALLFALAATLHPLMAAAIALPLAAAIVWRAHPRRRLAALLPAAAALGALALAVYLYLPLRAAAPHRALLVWGEPDSWQRFRDVVTAKAYGQNFAGDGFADRFAGHLGLVGEGTGLALLFLGAVGLCFGVATRLRGAAPLGIAALAAVAAAAAQKVFYPDNPDVHGYLTPVLALLAGGIVVIFSAAGRLAEGSRLLPFRLLWLFAFVPLLALALLGPYAHVGDAGFRRRDDALRYVDATIGRMPPGPGLYLTNSDHALFPALYERLVAGGRPDIAVANRDLLLSSWFLRMLKRSVPELYVPWVDDGTTAGIPDGFVIVNLRAGRPVGGERWMNPELARSIPRGLGWLYRLDGGGPAAELPLPPRRFEGDLGGRVAMHAALLRADFEASAGDWGAAAVALGVADRFPSLHTSTHQPLFTGLPRRTLAFIHAPFVLEAAVRDLAFAAGQGPGEPPAEDQPYELRVLFAWHLVLADDGRADAALDALGPDDPFPLLHLGATLAKQGRTAAAEPVFRLAVRRHPSSAAVWRDLGTFLGKAGRPDEARAAWQRSLELDADQPELRGFIER